ncbi:MAG: hypothetical protein PVI59_04775 [Anaerolineae bacterium]
MGLNRICFSAPAIAWVRDAGRTLLVDQMTGASLLLQGAEAVIWDLVVAGHSYDRLIPMLAAILSLSEEKARIALVGALAVWQEKGFLIVSEGEEDGQSGHQHDL